MLHPYTVDRLYMRQLAARTLRATYRGKAAHAAVSPHLGLNALEGLMLAFAGLNALRQHLTPDARIHGIVTEGGAAPNIIPDRAQAIVMVRASSSRYLQDVLMKRVEGVFAGAAMMTGTELSLEQEGPAYHEYRRNPILERFLQEAAEAVGRHFLEPPAGEYAGSTDAGNLSHHLPTLHGWIDVCGGGAQVGLHTREFAHISAMPYAYEAALEGSLILAITGALLLARPQSVEQAWAVHREQGGSVS